MAAGYRNYLAFWEGGATYPNVRTSLSVGSVLSETAVGTSAVTESLALPVTARTNPSVTVSAPVALAVDSLSFGFIPSLAASAYTSLTLPSALNATSSGTSDAVVDLNLPVTETVVFDSMVHNRDNGLNVFFLLLLSDASHYTRN